MKLKRAVANNRKGQIELTTRSGKSYPFPYAKLDPRPTSDNRVREVYIDSELGNEAATYVLESGDEGSIHIEHALEYNEDAAYLSELLTHRLTVEARKRAESSGLSRREIARRLGTSVPQLYRLLDPTNTRKTINQLVTLLHVLDCDVELIIKKTSAA